MRRDVNIEGHLIVSVATPPEAVAVARLVDGDAVNPGPQRRVAAEAMNRAEDAKEDFLGQVEGLVAVAQQIDRELHHHALVLAHQLRAGHLVARCTPLHERRFAHADVRPIRGAGLLHKEIPVNLLHYSQVRHPTRGKVPSPSDTMM